MKKRLLALLLAVGMGSAGLFASQAPAVAPVVRRGQPTAPPRLIRVRRVARRVYNNRVGNYVINSRPGQFVGNNYKNPLAIVGLLGAIAWGWNEYSLRSGNNDADITLDNNIVEEAELAVEAELALVDESMEAVETAEEELVALSRGEVILKLNDAYFNMIKAGIFTAAAADYRAEILEEWNNGSQKLVLQVGFRYAGPITAALTVSGWAVCKYTPVGAALTGAWGWIAGFFSRGDGAAGQAGDGAGNANARRLDALGIEIAGMDRLIGRHAGSLQALIANRDGISDQLVDLGGDRPELAGFVVHRRGEPCGGLVPLEDYHDELPGEPMGSDEGF